MTIISHTLVAFVAATCLGCETADQTAPAVNAVTVAETQPAISMDHFELLTSDVVTMHFFAYHAARAQAGIDDWMSVPLLPEDAALLDNPAIAAAFAPVAKMYEPVIRAPLVRGGLFSFLVRLDGGVEGIEDPESKAVFEAFLPTYRTYFWPRHRAMAELFAYEIRAELAVHGPAMATAVADELDSDWGDEGYRAYVTPYVSWAGAMSGSRHVYFSARDQDIAKHPLEMFFHETAHNRPIGTNIRPAADAAFAALGKEDDRVWHYILFYATGRAAKRVLGDDYVTYIETTGLREREDLKPWYDALEAVWDEHDTLEARAMAAVALVAAQEAE